MARRQRSDDNQPMIVDRYRKYGCSVLVLSQTESIDLLIGLRGVDSLVEVKDGSKSPSRRRLTKHEQDFHAGWRGRKPRIVMSNDDVDRHVAELRGEADLGKSTGN